ncbi:MAG: pentapeptide repeat-containing protein [Leptolyngbyaceae cyanobacterium SM1_3_5]|nr:pentapeptide repeat-containing protein [Leptolyngbyaceae cyanobacterium SM1_3_5]
MPSKAFSNGGRKISRLLRVGTLAALVAIGLLVVWLVVEVPKRQAAGLHLQDSEKIFDAENKARATILQGLLGLSFLVTAYFALKNLQVAEKNREIAEQNWQLAEDKHGTDRFVKAVEMLANEKQEIRLGGIYSLKRIAEESQKNYWTVIEVLVAFIESRSLREQVGEDNKISADIQAALDVVGFQQAPEGRKIALKSANLRGASLKGARLANADFEFVNLSQASLSSSDLSEAKLGGNISFALFQEAILTKAQFAATNLEGTVFDEADLKQTMFVQANLRQAHFCKADLEGTIFHRSDITEADFREAKNLTPDQVKEAKNWGKALYDLDFAEQLGLSRDEQTRQAIKKNNDLIGLAGSDFVNQQRMPKEIRHQQNK